MIYKTCSKCRNKYEYGKKCSCLNKLNKEMQAINGVVDNFYTTPEWRNLRKRIILRDGAHCHRFLIKYNIISASNLEPHHIVARSINKELELEPTNLVTVCKTCNLQLQTKGVDWDHEITQLMDYTL